MPVPCARCSTPLPKWELRNGSAADCAACGTHNTVRLFPAALSQTQAAQADPALEGEAACFDHPGKRADAVCLHCGRFVCALCAVEVGSGLSCPSCLANPVAAQKTDAGNARMLYDTWALFLPFGLLAIWPLTILSAPAVVALALMKWRAPLSLIRRNRWRFAAGLGVAIVQGGLWVWFLWYVVAKARSGA